jgi:hypothetical protein
MNVDNNSENNSPPSKIRLEHVISFSDAIFAFSITFMASIVLGPRLKKVGNPRFYENYR